MVVLCHSCSVLSLNLEIFFRFKHALIFLSEKFTPSLERCIHHKGSFFFNIEERELVEIDFFSLSQLSGLVNLDSILRESLIDGFIIDVEAGLEELVGSREHCIL